MKRLLWALMAIAIASSAPAQTPAGGNFQVNTYTTGLQWFPTVGVEPDGDFVVVWGSDGQDGSAYGVFGQRYDRTGAVRGAEFQVNTFTAGYQSYIGRAAVAADKSGDFAVVWGSFQQDGNGWGVFGQRFASTGAPLGGEFQVNTYTAGNQGGLGPYQAIAMDMDRVGNFVVVWASYQDGDGTGIVGQRFDAAGSRVGGEFLVNTVTAGYQAAPDVALNASGQFVVVWSTPDATDYDVAAQRYAANGTPIGGEFIVNTYTTGAQSFVLLQAPSVEMDELGGFVVAWDGGNGQDGGGYGVFARRFDPAGNPAGAELQVNTYTTGNQLLSTLDADALGNFVVTWQSNLQDGASYGVFGQRVSASGARRGGEFRVNSVVAGFQGVPDVGSDEVGNFLVGFHGDTDGDGNGIFGQRYGGLFPTALVVDSTGNRVLEPGETVDVRPSWLNGNGAAQTFTGALTTPSGPPGGVPTIVDATGAYGTVANGVNQPCTDCYSVMVPAPSPRPATHWDALVVEAIQPDTQGQQKLWSLHVGNSFTDVPASNAFYRFIETLLHHGVTGGCTATEYCPSAATTREQMAVFVLAAREGPGYLPPACTTPVFNDVPASSPFCRFIEELAQRGVVSGCGNGNYCPSALVTREQMPVFALRTLDPAFTPPACVSPNDFLDVPETSPFCPWIEELARRGVVTGCGGGNYCPNSPVTREQMGVFIGATFGLTLYGP